MKKIFYTLLTITCLGACQNILEPEPVDLLTDDVVLNEPADVPNVEVGLYTAFRDIIPAAVIAGDFTADMLIHNGTFTQFRELGSKQITASNASVAGLWGSIYNTIYMANFILERLPNISGVRTSDFNRVMGTAHFLRGYAYFVALNTYGGVPEVTTTPIANNLNIPRASEADILALIVADYNEALDKLSGKGANAGYVSEYAVQAAVARLALYQQDWDQAETFATAVIGSNAYSLEPSFQDLVRKDLTNESIFDVVYAVSDDPGTSTNGLNNLFVGRREIIPSNPTIVALGSSAAGDRLTSMTFDATNLSGNDNGWSVAKYGTADANNNDVTVFRLGELYLIRAEARAHLGKVTGANSAQSDINALRTRANAPQVGSVSQSQMLQLIENERIYELAFEGHRWYDLVRTNRAAVVMPAFNANWKNAYEKWPIPQREIQNNPALAGQQNPGY